MKSIFCTKPVLILLIAVMVTSWLGSVTAVGGELVSSFEMRPGLYYAAQNTNHDEGYDFEIGDVSISKEDGITVQASVTPNIPGGGNVVVIFKLMEGDRVVGLYSGEQYSKMS